MKKLRGKRGFTLTELLMAILILGIMGVGLTTGTSAAIQVYHGSIFVSESQLLSSTLDTALSDVLRYAKFESVDESSGTVHFTTNTTTYRINKGSLLVEGDRLRINPTDAPAGDGTALVNLLGGSSYSGMKLTDFSLGYADGIFSGSYTLQDKDDATMEKTFAFSYRTLVD